MYLVSKKIICAVFVRNLCHNETKLYSISKLVIIEIQIKNDCLYRNEYLNKQN
jgi:hypothetical protein